MAVRHPLVVLLLGLTASAAQAAAPPAAQVGEQITVELVNVDVHVTDREGRAVSGLERSAFHLFDNGQPVEVTHFAWIPARRAAAQRGARSHANGAAGASAPPRRIALFFDELQVSNRGRIPLLRALAQQLVDNLGPDDQISIVRFDGAELDLVLPWTGERRKIDRGLESLGAFSPRRLAAEQDLRSFLNLLHEDITGGVAKKNAGGCPTAGVILRGYADLVRRNAQASADALLRYAQRLSHEPGPRLLVHVSDGIPLQAGAEAYQYAIDMCSGEGVNQGVPGAFSVYADDINADGNTRDRFNPFQARLEMSEYQMAPLWRDVAARVNALGVTIYAVQASDPESQFLPTDELGIVPSAVRALAQQNPVDTLELLARETGGLLLRADRGADAEIGRLAADLGGYYSLAFTPAAEGRPGARAIRVEVDRPGVRLRYRQTYHRTSRDERIAGQLAEVFDAARVENPLGVALRFPGGSSTSGQRVRVEVPMGGLTLIEGGEGAPSGRFVVYVTVRDGRGVLLPRRQDVPVSVSGSGARFYVYDVDLPQVKDGAEVAVAVSDEYSGEVSFARALIPKGAGAR